MVSASNDKKPADKKSGEHQSCARLSKEVFLYFFRRKQEFSKKYFVFFFWDLVIIECALDNNKYKVTIDPY